MTDQPQSPPPPPTEPQMLRSDELLRGAREVSIQHGTATYRLRLTSNDKLILTK